LLLVAFLLVNALDCHLSLVLASVVQCDAVNCNIFYQAYCTLVMRYSYVTGGVWTSFQISRSTGVSI